MTDLSSLTHSLLEAATRAGAEAADALAVSSQAVSLDIRRGALEQAERSESVDIGLRVLMDGRQACVSVSDVSPRSLMAVAERAVAMAREAPRDPNVGLAEPDQIAKDWDLAALDLIDASGEPEIRALEEAARRAEAAALGAGDIRQVETTAAWGCRHMHLAATNGFSGGYSRSATSVSAVAFTGEGTSMERDYAGESRIYAADLPAPETIGTLAAERALARRGARRPATGHYPVLFDERVAQSLIGHLLSAVNGAAVARGSSWLRDGLGTQVLPRGYSLIEDPHRTRIPGSRPFDAEGLATGRRLIVENGILQGWTLDLATGRKLGMASTANAARGTTAPPSPATSNLDFTPGTATRAQLVGQMGTGLLVTSLIGATINATTGDYSRGASGFWVENGQIAYAVNECTIAGNLREMLLSLIAANDARPHLGTRVPSLLVEGMTLAGE